MDKLKKSQISTVAPLKKYAESRKKWYEANYEKNYKSKDCLCGGKISIYGWGQHTETKRHLEYYKRSNIKSQ